MERAKWIRSVCAYCGFFVVSERHFLEQKDHITWQALTGGYRSRQAPSQSSLLLKTTVSNTGSLNWASILNELDDFQV